MKRREGKEQSLEGRRRKDEGVSREDNQDEPSRKGIIRTREEGSEIKFVTRIVIRLKMIRVGGNIKWGEEVYGFKVVKRVVI